MKPRSARSTRIKSCTNPRAPCNPWLPVAVISVAERLPDEFEVALEATAAARGVFGARLIYATEVGSTNDLAAAAADGGAAEGTTFVAGAQTAGRGRPRRPGVLPPGPRPSPSPIRRRASPAPRTPPAARAPPARRR